MRTVVVAVLLLASLVVQPANLRAEESTLDFGRFGRVTLYRQTPHPANVILFASGDGGWNKGVVDMARQLAGMDTLVAGIDVVHYLRQLAASGEPCSYPAADFESLSHFLQQRLGFPQYRLPVLIGYSSGAALVYATLAQSPPGTFLGAISMGFCPDLPLDKHFCRGSGLSTETGPKGKGIVFLPCTHLKEPWIALQGTLDQVCDPTVAQRFAGRVANGEIVMLPKVGHGFGVPAHWLPQLRAAFLKIAGRQAAVPAVNTGLADLPLETVPATGAPRDVLALIITGDGGWAGLDQELAAGLAEAGIDVVALNSLKYFWRARTPDQLGADVERILQHYLGRWQKRRILLVGYSMGADVLPFAVNRLSAAIRDRVNAVALLAPGRRASFEFHLSDWLGGAAADGEPIKPEVERIRGPEIVCLYGQEETDSLCPLLAGGRIKVLEMAGGHHFGGDSAALVRILIANAGR